MLKEQSFHETDITQNTFSPSPVPVWLIVADSHNIKVQVVSCLINSDGKQWWNSGAGILHVLAVFRLGSTALCWYVTSAELCDGVKPKNVAQFFPGAHLCAANARIVKMNVLQNETYTFCWINAVRSHRLHFLVEVIFFFAQAGSSGKSCIPIHTQENQASFPKPFKAIFLTVWLFSYITDRSIEEQRHRGLAVPISKTERGELFLYIFIYYNFSCAFKATELLYQFTGRVHKENDSYHSLCQC